MQASLPVADSFVGCVASAEDHERRIIVPWGLVSRAAVGDSLGVRLDPTIFHVFELMAWEYGLMLVCSCIVELVL